MKAVYPYVLDTLADWELGYVLAELNTGRFTQGKTRWQVRACGATTEPITTAGGLLVTPQIPVTAINPSDVAVFILPGADTWGDAKHAPALALAKTLLAQGVPVAAICGGTLALAQAGLLNDKKHTSNGKMYLQLAKDNYSGASLYMEEATVVDDNLITAGSDAPVEFARAILATLDALPKETLDAWYGYYGEHDQSRLPTLLKAMGVPS